ncbi:MAG: hypothetical protein RBG13Loki_2789 [Promethearchaeota archaeon CR_4]|nr:MAG: hypothetical protein RBG13Loki_2789 [Candidatus Lokiarchaeota archaeon CR_4]
MAHLAVDKEHYVRARVAEKCHASPEILTQLAQDSEKIVRIEVAKNLNSPPKSSDRSYLIIFFCPDRIGKHPAFAVSKNVRKYGITTDYVMES